MVRFLMVGVLLAALAACTSGEDMQVAIQGVADFRRQMEQQEFAQVYAGGSEELRKSASEADMARILGGLRTRLGKVQNAERNGWHVNWHTSGTFVTLGFKTRFENGAGAEQFVFRVVDGKASLVSYNINSPALLPK